MHVPSLCHELHERLVQIAEIQRDHIFGVLSSRGFKAQMQRT
jgi:hypothetical protein